MTAFAVAASSFPKAIADGPVRSGVSASAAGLSLGRDAHQAVLDDPVRHVALAQRAPDLGDLLHLEAAVLGDDHRAIRVQDGTQRVDRLSLGLGRHLPP
jgi:hypothetical protein